ncbi:MAG: hypothetical protein HFG69_00280 [Hungatella sp.]|nr:hypothetical protein [Hungatella sp.]
MKIQANLPIAPFQALSPHKTGKKNQTVQELMTDMGMPTVKVSFSKEGMDTYRRMVKEKGQPSAMTTIEEVENSTILLEQLYGSLSTDTVYFSTEEEVLKGEDRSKNIVSLWFSNEVRDLKERDVREGQGNNTWRDKAARLAQAYASLYDEITEGYRNGTREVKVVEKGASVPDLAQGRGYRVLTMEEELAELDAVYEKEVKWLERMAEEWPKQFEIFCRMDESRSRTMDREPYYTEEKVKELKEDYKTVPDNLAQRMLTVRDCLKLSRQTLSKDKAWESVVEIINTMFRRRE